MSRILILILMNLPGKMVLLIGLNMLQLKKTIRNLKITEAKSIPMSLVKGSSRSLPTSTAAVMLRVSAAWPILAPGSVHDLI